MTDPMKDIEDAKGQIDMGVMAGRVYQGALQESGFHPLHAFYATAAFFYGMFKGSQEEGGENNDDNST